MKDSILSSPKVEVRNMFPKVSTHTMDFNADDYDSKTLVSSSLMNDVTLSLEKEWEILRSANELHIVYDSSYQRERQ